MRLGTPEFGNNPFLKFIVTGSESEQPNGNQNSYGIHKTPSLQKDVFQRSNNNISNAFSALKFGYAKMDFPGSFAYEMNKLALKHQNDTIGGYFYLENLGAPSMANFSEEPSFNPFNENY